MGCIVPLCYGGYLSLLGGGLDFTVMEDLDRDEG